MWLVFHLFLCPLPPFRLLRVSEEDKSQAFRDPNTGLCVEAGSDEIGLVVNAVNNKDVQVSGCAWCGGVCGVCGVGVVAVMVVAVVRDCCSCAC